MANTFGAGRALDTISALIALAFALAAGAALGTAARCDVLPAIAMRYHSTESSSGYFR